MLGFVCKVGMVFFLLKVRVLVWGGARFVMWDRGDVYTFLRFLGFVMMFLGVGYVFSS